MRDEETGSWWQQVSGEAIFGPLKGNHLELVFHDELSFALWKSENPQGRVLRPDEKIAAAGRYAPADWESRIGRMSVVTRPTDSRLEPRALIAGVSFNGAAKAYPMSILEKQSPIIDNIAGVSVLLVIGDDRKSVRAFETSVDGRTLEFFAKTGASPLRLVDSETGSEWDFTGKAVNGPLSGKQLRRADVLEDYWFDWKIYHPETDIYQPGE
jgi:Protein of unknown function (DUF3179)